MNSNKFNTKFATRFLKLLLEMKKVISSPPCMKSCGHKNQLFIALPSNNPTAITSNHPPCNCHRYNPLPLFHSLPSDPICPTMSILLIRLSRRPLRRRLSTLFLIVCVLAFVLFVGTVVRDWPVAPAPSAPLQGLAAGVAGTGTLMQSLQGSTGIFRALEGFSGMIRALQGSIQGSSGIYRVLQGSTVLYRALQGCTGIFRDLQGSTGLLRAFQGSSGLLRARQGS
jgi:hypothetical protein